MGKAKKQMLKKKLSHPYSKDSSRGITKLPTKQSANPKPKPKHAPKTQASQQPDVPFEFIDRILLVGEGDFSFAASLHNHHKCTSLTATTLETRSDLLTKYSQATAHIASLEAGSHKVLYSIDATKLGHPHTPGAASLRKARFDTIIFNFPHVGGKSTDVNRQVRANQDLVVRFLEAAKAQLVQGGKILLTVFEGQPYELWGVRNLARHAGLVVDRSMRFDAELYPGYKHARTLGNVVGGGGWKGEERQARMFVLMLQGGAAAIKKTKTDSDDEDDD